MPCSSLGSQPGVASELARAWQHMASAERRYQAVAACHGRKCRHRLKIIVSSPASRYARIAKVRTPEVREVCRGGTVHARPRAPMALQRDLEADGGRRPRRRGRDWPGYKELSARVEQIFNTPSPMVRIVLTSTRSSESPSSAMSPPPRADSQAVDPRPPSRTGPETEGLAAPQGVDADGKGKSVEGRGPSSDSGGLVSTHQPRMH